jgi:peptidoglycan/LPS O-acetylase OafA/YrhL
MEWNHPAWSLSVEALFYLSFPFIGLRLCQISRRSLVLLMVALWPLTLIAWAVLAGVHPDGLDNWAATGEPPNSLWVMGFKFHPLLHLPQFVFGVALGRLYLTRPSTTAKPSAWVGYRLYLPALLILGVILALSDSIPCLLLHNGVLMPLFGLLIFGFATGNDGFIRLLSTPIILLLGEASYALYILHVPVMAYFRYFLGPPGGWAYREVTVVFYAVLVIGLSVVVFLWFEVPARAAIRRIFAARTPRASLAVADLPGTNGVRMAATPENLPAAAER